MIGKILIWFYIIFIVPPLAIVMAGLIYGGIIEVTKQFKNEVSVSK